MMEALTEDYIHGEGEGAVPEGDTLPSWRPPGIVRFYLWYYCERAGL